MRCKSESEVPEALSNLTTEEKAFLETVPIFINVRDRLICLEKLLDWLERAGHRNITLIDNASTYPPLLSLLDQCKYRTIRLKRNLGNSALWRLKELRGVITNEWFVYTDPDVIPADTCPLDVVVQMRRMLQKFPFYLKAGLGLRLDDLPDRYHLKRAVIDWEQHLIGKEIAQEVFEADVDTTFALYRPGAPCTTGPSVRFQGRYSARHLPWYCDSSEPDEEERYYRNHALSGVTTWSVKGNERYQRKTVPGGIATRIRRDPHAFLKGIRRSGTGRIASLLAILRPCSSNGWRRLFEETSPTPEEARQTIVKVITSEDWNRAWRLTDPWRRAKYRLRSFLRI
jgi:hypothetical protein